MTVRRICPTHGAYEGRSCPACRDLRATRTKPRTEASAIRSTARWKRTASRIIARDRHRCTYGTHEDETFWMPDGRCPVVDGLDVHHIVPIENGGAPFDDRNLRTVCQTHNRRLDAEHRRRRAEARA